MRPRSSIGGADGRRQDLMNVAPASLPHPKRSARLVDKGRSSAFCNRIVASSQRTRQQE